MTTLEKIRAEIEDVGPKSYVQYGMRWTDSTLMIPFHRVMQIIDKYAEQEPSRNIKEIAEIMKCDADAETKCKMISNILTAKPHYFAEQEPCDDVVSRQAVLEIIDGWYEQNRDTENIEDLIVLITYMDSVRPQEQTGHWEFFCQHWRKCSECGYPHKFAEDWDYCPNCGARMDKPKTRGWKADTIILDEDVFMSIPYERQESSGEK